MRTCACSQWPRAGGLITKRPTDVGSEGCVRYFAFAMIEYRDQPHIATFQVGPSGALGRVVPRPATEAPHRTQAKERVAQEHAP